jgi:hypothetical protein
MDADDRKVLKDLRNLHLGRASRVKIYSVHRQTKAGRDQELIVEVYDEGSWFTVLAFEKSDPAKKAHGHPDADLGSALGSVDWRMLD